jgi:hypothetical protein
MPQAWEYWEPLERPRHPPTELAQPAPWRPRRYSQTEHLQRLAPRRPPEDLPQRGPAPAFTPASPQQARGAGLPPAFPPAYRGQPRRPHYPPPQPPYYPPPQQVPPRRGNRTGRTVLLGVCGGIFAIVVIAVAASSSPSASAPTAAQARSAARAQPTTAARSATAPAPPAAKTVATFSGNGTENTAQFTVTGTWKLDYSFNCSDFGGQGNFQVFEDGGQDLNGVQVNALSTGQSGSTMAYGDGGTHYLEINSECAWTVRVIDQG